MRRAHALSLALAATLALTACPSATAPPVEPPPARPDADLGIDVPDSGFWERTGPGAWTYDLGTFLTSDLQLTARPPGQGFLRVALPPGAGRAVLTSLSVVYARNAAAMSDDGQDPTAGGEATWTFYADAAGAPGRELGHIDVTVDATQAIPLEDGGDPVVHALPGLEVPAVFWAVFSVRSGDPRVAAMRVNTPEGVQFTDLYYRAQPDAPLGAPVNARPYLRFVFEQLSR